MNRPSPGRPAGNVELDYADSGKLVDGTELRIPTADDQLDHLEFGKAFICNRLGLATDKENSLLTGTRVPLPVSVIVAA